ncbi:MAG TPA: anthranilate synthase component I family protein [Acidimicrobiia bacterium]
MEQADVTASELVRSVPPGVAAAAVRRGRSTVVGAVPDEVVVARGTDAFGALDSLTPGFWVGWCAFELGHAVERVAGRGASTEPPSVADMVFARFDAVAVVDPRGGIEVRGDGAGRTLLDAAVSGHAAQGTVRTVAAPVAPSRWRTGIDRGEYNDRVRAVLDLLRAGECYQVNLTRRLTCDDALDPIALYTALARAHPAPHLALLQLPDVGDGTAVVSASPERYLRLRHRDVETRPIKGTAATSAALRASSKDHAENVMIVDLARNDLGRVCEPGSVHVPELCAVESHPGLHHLVSTARGRLRDDVGVGALVRATFPPASVTGAPKPRVLQVIEDLEPVRRGVYCGALGWIDTSAGDPERITADLAVAIRTFTVLGAPGAGCTHFSVGGGIVADSRPDAEWAETELKAARLLAVAGAEACERVDGANVRAAS